MGENSLGMQCLASQRARPPLACPSPSPEDNVLASPVLCINFRNPHSCRHNTSTHAGKCLDRHKISSSQSSGPHSCGEQTGGPTACSAICGSPELADQWGVESPSTKPAHLSTQPRVPLCRSQELATCLERQTQPQTIRDQSMAGVVTCEIWWLWRWERWHCCVFTICTLPPQEDQRQLAGMLRGVGAQGASRKGGLLGWGA